MLKGDNDLPKCTSVIARLSNLSVSMPTPSRTAVRTSDSWDLIGAPQTSPIDVLPSTMRLFFHGPSRIRKAKVLDHAYVESAC